MPGIADAFATAFRDFSTDGVPSSDKFEPPKALIRALGRTIESAIGIQQLGAMLATTAATRSALGGSLAFPAGSMALVYADGTDANNDIYVKTGASGTGAWNLTSILHDAAAGAANTQVSLAAGYADSASGSALNALTSAGTAEDSAAAAAAVVTALTHFRATRAAAVADSTIAVGGYFASAETGELAIYIKTGTSGAAWTLVTAVGDVRRVDLASSATGKGASLIGSQRGGTIDDATYSVIDLMQFKGVGNISPDAAAFQRAADYCANSGRRYRLLLPDQPIRVGAQVAFPVGVSMGGTGRNTVIMPEAGAVYGYTSAGVFHQDDFIFHLNSDGSTWPTQYPNVTSGVVENLRLVNDLGVDVRAIQFAGSYAFREMHVTGFGQIIQQVGEYCDAVELYRIFSANDMAPKAGWGASGTALIKLGLGDALWAHALQIAAPSTATRVLLSSWGCRGGFVSGTINGVLAFEQCQGLFVVGGHHEFGGIDITDSNISIHDTILFHEASLGRTPIRLLSNTGIYGNRNEVLLEKVEFMACVDARGGFPTSLEADLQINPYTTVRIRDCRRSISQNGNISYKRGGGIIVADSTGTLLEDFNSKSALASIDSRISSEKVLFGRPAQTGHKTTHGGLGNPISTDGITTWPLATGTYYYQGQVIYDRVRKLGHTMWFGVNERSVALTSGGPIPNIAAGDGSVGQAQSGWMVRIYRGTSTGAYTAYVDVPFVDLPMLLDTGNHLNGYPWITRASGGVDVLNNFVGEVTFSGANIFATFTNAYTNYLPTVGSYVAGDSITFEPPVTESDGRVVYRLVRLTTGSNHVLNTDWRRDYATPFGRIPSLAKSAAYTATSADIGKTIDCTAGSSGFAVTLPASGMVEGDCIWVRKVDAGAGDITCSGQTMGPQWTMYGFRYSVARTAWEVMYTSAAARTASRAISAATTLTSADIGKIIDCTAGSGGFAVTLPASGMVEGDNILIRKVDAGAGNITCSGQTLGPQWTMRRYRYSAVRTAWEVMLG